MPYLPISLMTSLPRGTVKGTGLHGSVATRWAPVSATAGCSKSGYLAQVWPSFIPPFLPASHLPPFLPPYYAAVCGNAGSLTHQARPGIEPASSRTLYWVLNLLSHNRNSVFSFSFFLFFLVFCPFRAAPTAYRSFQVRGLIGAVAAGLHHRHSKCPI